MYNKRLFMSNEMRRDPNLISSCVLHCNKFCGMLLPFCVANGHKLSIAYYRIIDYYRNAAGSRGSRRLRLRLAVSFGITTLQAIPRRRVLGALHDKGDFDSARPPDEVHSSPQANGALRPNLVPETVGAPVREFVPQMSPNEARSTLCPRMHTPRSEHKSSPL